MNIDYTGVLALWSLNSTFVKLHNEKREKWENSSRLP